MGEQAVNGRGELLGAAREMTVGKDLGSKGSTGVIGEAGSKSGWEGREDGWMEFVTKAVKGEGV